MLPSLEPCHFRPAQGPLVRHHRHYDAGHSDGLWSFAENGQGEGVKGSDGRTNYPEPDVEAVVSSLAPFTVHVVLRWVSALPGKCPRHLAYAVRVAHEAR